MSHLFDPEKIKRVSFIILMVDCRLMTQLSLSSHYMKQYNDLIEPRPRIYMY